MSRSACPLLGALLTVALGVVAAGAAEPIAVLELFDVQIGGPVDATAFVYKPAAEGLIDLTDGYVQGLGPMRP